MSSPLWHKGKHYFLKIMEWRINRWRKAFGAQVWKRHTEHDPPLKSALREKYGNQQEAGLLPLNTEPPPWPSFLICTKLPVSIITALTWSHLESGSQCIWHTYLVRLQDTEDRQSLEKYKTLMNCMREYLFTWSDCRSDDNKANGNVCTAANRQM